MAYAATSPPKLPCAEPSSSGMLTNTDREGKQ
jgi:hypothetical protein